MGIYKKSRKPTWRDVLDFRRMDGYLHLSQALEYALELGYPCILWNDRVLEVISVTNWEETDWVVAELGE